MIQFTASGGIQFKLGEIQFGSGCDCACDPVEGSDQTPPSQDPDCTDCRAIAPCNSCLDCTPGRLRVTLAGITLRTACLACSGSSVKVVSSDFTTPFQCYQSPSSVCRWRAEVNSTSVVVVRRYTAATDCTGASEDTSALTVDVDSIGASTFAVTAYVTFPDGEQYVLFTGTANSDCKTGFTAAGFDAYPFACGERLGQGGTATVAVCPVLPPVCDHTNSDGSCYSCLKVVGLTFPGDCAACNTSTGQDTWLEQFGRDSGTTWSTPANKEIDGCGNTQVFLAWRSKATADSEPTFYPRGCGYYLDVYVYGTGTDSRKLVYYHDAALPTGTYVKCYAECGLTEFADEITVTQCPGSSCGSYACGGWPTAASVHIEDMTDYAGVVDCASITGDYVLTRDPTSGTYAYNHYVDGVFLFRLTLTCSSGVWTFTLADLSVLVCVSTHVNTTISFTGPPAGNYTFNDVGCTGGADWACYNNMVVTIR